MKSEEKLNRLFETLRADKALTSVSDVTSWIEASAPVTVSKSTSKIFIQKNLFIMSSIVGIVITGIVLMTRNAEPNIIPTQNDENKATIADTSTSPLVQQNQLRLENSSVNEKTFMPPQLSEDVADIPFVEIPSVLEIVQDYSNIPTQIVSIESFKSDTGSWFSSNDSLHVDTLFNGVKSLVFKGDKSDIVVQGSERKNLSMKYNYQLNTKGVFSRKKEGNCELSYVLEDSVLTIHLQRKDEKISGISVVSETSKIEFNVPQNVNVKMDSDLGDIDVSRLKTKSAILHTSLGDISASNIQGSIYFVTDLGDISMRNLTGRINCSTSLGDVSGKNISVQEECKLESSLGDIDVQLTNPLSDCRLHLSSSLGKVKIIRPELKKKSASQLIIGDGKLNVVMETSLGKVIVR
jgi:hypothetical protein